MRACCLSPSTTSDRAKTSDKPLFLWDSVRESELDPKDYVELVVKNLATEKDEGTIQTLLGRVSTAMNYWFPYTNNAGDKNGA